MLKKRSSSESAVTQVDDDAKLAELVSILSFDKDMEESFPTGGSAVPSETRSAPASPASWSPSGDNFSGYVSKDGTISLSVNFSSPTRVETIPLVIFAIDTSASMTPNIETIKSLLKIFYSKYPLFIYELIQFSSTAKLAFSSLGSDLFDSRFAPTFSEAIDRIKCEGNTNYQAAFSLISRIRNSLVNIDRQGFIVFITDGVPTVGETSEERLISLLSPIDKRSTRFISLGFPGIEAGTSLLKKIGSYYELYSGDFLSFLGAFSLEISKSFSFSAILKIPVDIDIYVGDLEISPVYPGREFKFVGRVEDPKSLLVELELETFSKIKRILRRRIELTEKADENDLELIRRVRLEEIREKIVKSFESKRREKRKMSDDGETKELKEELKELIAGWPHSLIKLEGERILKEDIYQIISSYNRQHDILDYYKKQHDYTGFFSIKKDQVDWIETLVRSTVLKLPSNPQVVKAMKHRGVPEDRFLISRSILSDIDVESEIEEEEPPILKRRGI